VDLSRTLLLTNGFVVDLSQTCRKRLDMSRWFVSANFMICVAYFAETSRFRDLSPFVSATFMICVHDLSPRKSFDESWHNGIWALLSEHTNMQSDNNISMSFTKTDYQMLVILHTT